MAQGRDPQTSFKMAMKMRSMMKKAAGGMKKMRSMMKKGAMKSMMKRRAMKVSKIAKGRQARSQVLKGRKVKTVGGLTKDKLTRNKYGKVVSKKASQAAKSGKSAKWAKSVQAARK